MKKIRDGGSCSDGVTCGLFDTERGTFALTAKVIDSVEARPGEVTVEVSPEFLPELAHLLAP